MGQYFVLAHQSRRRDLRHHKAGIKAGTGGKKRRQTLAERWIYKPFDPALADAGERTERDGKKV